MRSDPRLTRGAAFGLAVLALGATAACTGSVKGSDIESRLRQEVKGAGLTATDVACPDLDAAKGESVTCTFSVQKQKYRTTIMVSSVDGNKVDYVIGRPRPAS